jgi:hypothetical protein
VAPAAGKLTPSVDLVRVASPGDLHSAAGGFRGGSAGNLVRRMFADVEADVYVWSMVTTPIIRLQHRRLSIGSCRTS